MMRGIRALLLTLILAAGLIALMAGLWWQSGRLLTVFWRQRLAAAPEDQAGELLDQVAGSGEMGTSVLVEALNSPRPGVAQAAREVLWDALVGWDRLPRRESSRRLLILAEALAGHAERFRLSAQTDTAELATQILLRPLDETVAPRWRVTRACDRVLAVAKRSTAEASRGLARAQAGKASASSAMAGEEKERTRPNQPTSLTATPESDASEGEPTTVPNQSSRLFGPPQADASTRAVGSPSVLPGQLAQNSSGGEGRSLEGLEATRDGEFVRETPRLLLPSVDGTSEKSAGRQESSAIDVDTVEVMRRLQSPHPATAAEARTELARRGFSDVQLELARRLFDPDVEARKGLIRVLPEMRSIDATPWLLQLCRDENAEVRRGAFSLLATTTDPGLLERLLQIARQDPDPGIQRQVERLAGRREGQQSPMESRLR